MKTILLTTMRICITQSYQFYVLSFYVIYLPVTVWDSFILDNFSEKKQKI